MGEQAILSKVYGTFSSLLRVNSRLDCSSELTVISALVKASFLQTLTVLSQSPSPFHSTRYSSGKFLRKLSLARQKKDLPQWAKKILLCLLWIWVINLHKFLLLERGQWLLIQRPMTGKGVLSGQRRMRQDLSMLSGPHCSRCWLRICDSFSLLTNLLLGTGWREKERSCLARVIDSYSPFLRKLTSKGGRDSFDAYSCDDWPIPTPFSHSPFPLSPHLANTRSPSCLASLTATLPSPWQYIPLSTLHGTSSCSSIAALLIISRGGCERLANPRARGSTIRLLLCIQIPTYCFINKNSKYHLLNLLGLSPPFFVRRVLLEDLARPCLEFQSPLVCLASSFCRTALQGLEFSIFLRIWELDLGWMRLFCLRSWFLGGEWAGRTSRLCFLGLVKLWLLREFLQIVFYQGYRRQMSWQMILRYCCTVSFSLSSTNGTRNLVQLRADSSSFCQNSDRHLAFRAYSTVILFLGLNSSIRITRASSSWSTLRKYSFAGFLRTLTCPIRFSATSLARASMLSWEGTPVNSMIFSSWWRVEVPGKRGRPMSSQAMMQPTLHTSVGLEQLLDPSSISGDLYQRVATSSVRIILEVSSQVRVLASPKSQSLTVLGEPYPSNLS